MFYEILLGSVQLPYTNKKEFFMARPNKSKRVRSLPGFESFAPCGREHTENKLILSVEEFETIRLLDYLGMTQEECAQSMQVGRATVQMLYTEAR